MILPKIFPVTSNSKLVGPGSTFVAIKGAKHDGALFIKDAISSGAKKIVIEQISCNEEIFNLCKNSNVSLEIVSSARKELSKLAANALGNPSDKLKLVGITGTKGKTTSSFLIDHILQSSEISTGLVGSIKNKFSIKKDSFSSQDLWNIIEQPARLTTPESDELLMFLAECINKSITHSIIEVSSHALSLHRVEDIKFDAVGFLNLHNDHMDFYKNMNDYFYAKLQLFDKVKPNGTIVINIDDPWGKKAFELAKNKYFNTNIITFGQQSHKHTNKQIKHIQFSVAEKENLEITITTNEQEEINCPKLLGTFNSYNIMLAKIISQTLGIDTKKINLAINQFPGIQGRMTPYRLKNGALGIVDYAHNALSTESVLKFLRLKTKHLIVVCGAGGDRDPSRRPQIAQIASELADKIIITIGNPRTESPSKIINDFFSAIPKDKQFNVILEQNRLNAIHKAVESSKPESIIAILGQGHEPYHLVGDEETFFTDYDELCKY